MSENQDNVFAHNSAVWVGLSCVVLLLTCLETTRAAVICSSTGMDGLDGLTFLVVGASIHWAYFRSSPHGFASSSRIDLYVVVSDQHFKRTKEDISRHLGDWVVELTWCHFYRILIKANLRLRNEKIDLLLIGGAAKYCGHILRYTTIMLSKPKTRCN